MNRFLFFAFLAAMPVMGQTVSTPTEPTLTPSPVFSVGGGALALDVPSLTNATTGPGTVLVTNAQVVATLSNLEFQVSTALPVLAAFNDHVVITNSTAAAALNTSAPAMGMSLIPGTGVTNAVGTNAIVAVPNRTDTLRALLVLQSDLQRILPTLDVLNGGTNFAGMVLPGFVPGVFTNDFPATTVGPR